MHPVNLDPGGVCVTAPASESRQVSSLSRAGKTSTGSTKVDFVSRFFTPQASILEDPVTGSAHCSFLIPFWAQRLGKDSMVAQQLSDRVGTLYCQNVTEECVLEQADCETRNRVFISGRQGLTSRENYIWSRSSDAVNSAPLWKAR